MSLRLATQLQLLHRPHLITPAAAMELANRIRAVDPRAFERRAGPFAVMRKKVARAIDNAFNGLRADAYDMGQAGEMRAMEDDGDYVATTRPVAYAPIWMGEPDVQLDWGWSVKDGVAMMEISGPLAERGGYVCGEWTHGYDTIAAAIAEADANGAVRAMLIRFDTPGGVVASGLDDLAAMLQARKARPNAKLLWAHCEMACSAGYWIASQFDNVLAPKAGLTGSIGAVLVHEDYSGALEKMGVKVTSIEFPADGQKTEGAPWKALSEDGLADLQAMINHCGEAFLAAVETGRGGKLSAERAINLKARVFTSDNSDASRSALALGLIDGVMSEQAAFDALQAELKPGATQIRPAASAGHKPARATAPAKPAATAAQTTEHDMSLRKALAAVLKKTEAKTADEKLTEIQKILDEPPEEEVDEEDVEEEPAEAEAAEGDEEEPEQDDPKSRASAPGRKPNASTVLAILDLSEAKGREQQARKLAETPGMTADMAKGILAAGPKASRLADRATPVNVTPDGGVDTRSDVKKESDAAIRAAGIRIQ